MGQTALLVIASAGFGKRLSWTDDPTAEPPPGCKLTFRSAFMDAVRNIIMRVLVPGWFYSFSSLIKVPCLSARALRPQLAYADSRTHMLDLVASARAEITSGKRSKASGTALLRNLVEANMGQDGSSNKLTEGEILSNIFLSHPSAFRFSSLLDTRPLLIPLCFAIVFLALYPDCQKRLYEEVIRAWPANVPVTQVTTNHKDYVDKLEYTLACIRETLRLFPAEPRLPKDVHTDAVLPGTHFTPGSMGSPAVETGKFTMAVPAGSIIAIDIWHCTTTVRHSRLGRDPLDSPPPRIAALYWGDTAEFNPERFLDTASYQWPRHAFLPFSGGARSYIGQRFVITEMIGVIASVVGRYEIRVPDDLAKKPFEEQKETLLKWTTGISLTPVNARVKLCRRV
ncbi:cytochrome P450 [Imleria badia]|nr:cytochrome P450 [Imleria badia]